MAAYLLRLIGKQIPREQNIKKFGHGLVSLAYPVLTWGLLPPLFMRKGFCGEKNNMQTLVLGRTRIESWVLLGFEPVLNHSQLSGFNLKYVNIFEIVKLLQGLETMGTKMPW